LAPPRGGPEGRAPRATPHEYGFPIWAPSFVLGLAFAAAAFAKLFQGGVGWIRNGTVKYRFLSDRARRSSIGACGRFGMTPSRCCFHSPAIAVEVLVIVGVLARRYVSRLAAGVASLGLLSGCALFQGIVWPGWWVLLLSFLPWHRVGVAAPSAAPASWTRPLYPAAVVLVLIALQTVVSLFRLELSPVLSAYDMYSTTYASPADFEEKATDAH